MNKLGVFVGSSRINSFILVINFEIYIRFLYGDLSDSVVRNGVE